jgi:hypothetical protein
MEVDVGTRPGVTTEETQRIKALEHEVRELRKANEILKLASAFLPRRSSTAISSIEGFCRSEPKPLRGRAHLQGIAGGPIGIPALR